MKNSKPEEQKVHELIKEFDKAVVISEHEWNKLHDFIFWLYEKKKYMIIPQDKCQSSISDVHLK